ncbi:thioesterase II family protein [Chitinophaga sp. 30R24]|uniref:thioesterase II family protein n=1 Tax=Chitinophaga sp. 30R24 TaxID=3248838 RepID=UPI003B90B462
MQKPQLFLLHFAGGNRYSFKPLEHLLKDFEVILPELPGRGDRIGETLLRDAEAAARDFYRQISARVAGGGFMIYGHSMGAALSLRVTQLLEAEGKFPRLLMVGGNAGPASKGDRTTYLLSDDDFFEEVKKLGGLSEEVLNTPELLAFIEPILRADFEIAEKEELSAVVQSPIYGIMGSEEENAEKLFNWRQFTHADFHGEIVTGNHFFIFEHPEKVAGIIRQQYLKAVRSSNDLEIKNYT